jgi:hypothetical protein
VNSSSDTSVPAETFTVRTFSDYSSNIEKINDADSGGFDNGNDPTEDNPEDELSEYTAGIYFESSSWNENELTVTMRLAPTGKAPRESLGALFASINSTSVVAVLPNGQAANPQPGSLPSVSFSGLIAEPWDGDAEGLPEPPSNRIFEGQFAITFYEGDFPPAAENPAQQLTYRATVEFSNWQGGFTDVSYLNTLTVDFVPTEAPEEPEFEQSVFYWSGIEMLSTGNETINNYSLSESGSVTSSTLLSQPAVELVNDFGWDIPGGLVSNIGILDYTIEWFAVVPRDATGSAYISISFTSAYGHTNIIGQPNSVADILSLGGEEYVSACSGCDINTEITWSNPVHIAQQRIGDRLYLHINGALIGSVGDSGNSLPISASFRVEAALFTSNSVIYKLGQGRLTAGAALYGTGTFTPPTEAFYDPTP